MQGKYYTHRKLSHLTDLICIQEKLMIAKILARKEQVLDEDMHFPRFLFARLKIKAVKLQVSLIVCLGSYARRKGEKRTEFSLLFNCPKQKH